MEIAKQSDKQCAKCGSDDWKSAQAVVSQGSSSINLGFLSKIREQGAFGGTGKVSNLFLSDRWFTFEKYLLELSGAGTIESMEASDVVQTYKLVAENTLPYPDKPDAPELALERERPEWKRWLSKRGKLSVLKCLKEPKRPHTFEISDVKGVEPFKKRSRWEATKGAFSKTYWAFLLVLGVFWGADYFFGSVSVHQFFGDIFFSPFRAEAVGLVAYAEASLKGVGSFLAFALFAAAHENMVYNRTNARNEQKHLEKEKQRVARSQEQVRRQKAELATYERETEAYRRADAARREEHEQLKALYEKECKALEQHNEATRLANQRKEERHDQAMDDYYAAVVEVAKRREELWHSLKACQRCAHIYV